MTVQVRIRRDGLAISGELDMAAAEDFLDFASSAVDETKEVVLDIADLAFIDSAGTRAILRLAETKCPTAWSCTDRETTFYMRWTSSGSRRFGAFGWRGDSRQLLLTEAERAAPTR